MKGSISKPDMKNRKPANCNGVVYFKPILMATNGVAHNKQANMANMVVDRKNFFMAELKNFMQT
jgi:hypothetical protein